MAAIYPLAEPVNQRIIQVLKHSRLILNGNNGLFCRFMAHFGDMTLWNIC